MTYKLRSKKAKAAYKQRIKRRNQTISWCIAAAFILLNLIMAVYFWPKLQQHWEDIEAGRKKALIHIEYGENK